MGEKTELEQHLAELSLLHDLGKSLSATLDLPELLTQVIEVAVRLTQADEGVLFLPDSDSDALCIRAARHVGDQAARELHLPSDDNLAGRVMSTGQPIQVNNEEGSEQVRAEDLVRSSVYVPLVSKGHTIGVLGINNKHRPNLFTQHEQEMLGTLAGYAAIAIENALLFEKTVHRSRELALLVETANVLSSSLDLSRVLNAVTRQLTRALAADRCTISLWNPATRSARTLAEHRQAVWEGEQGPTYKLADFPVRRQVLSQTRPLCFPGEADQPGTQVLLRRWGAARMLALPLQVAGQVVGLAEMYDAQTSTPYTLEEVGRTMLAALQLAPLLLDPKTDQDWRKALLTATADLLASSGSDWCEVLIWQPEDEYLRTLLEYGGGAWIDEPVEAAELDQAPTLEVVLNEQRIATLSADDILEPADRMLLDEWHAKMMLAVPLVHKGETIGLIRLADVNQSRAVTRRELALAFALANQVAVGLENARLFRELALRLEELRQMQSRLVQAARLSALGELAAVVAHQINNPLTTVLADAEILVQDLPTDHPNHASAQAIWQAGKRAKTVVDRLLNLTRRDSEVRPVDVNITIHDTLALTQTHIERGSTSLLVDLTDDLQPVMAVPGQLEDVWLNLLINAREAIPAGRTGQVGIQSCAVADGWVEVVVWDNGVGIPDDHLPHMFEPFFTTKPRGEGTGLGLYICRQTVTQLGGQLNIESHLGVGTRVTVRLPVAGSQAT
jgi:signal transduction histidine kinase